jgi:glycosyltransferase involved in cell wall biosynthesis
MYCFQNPWPPRSGLHQRWLQMLRGLIAIGCEVTIASCEFHARGGWTEESRTALKKLGVRDVHVYAPRIAGRICNRLERMVPAARRGRSGLVSSYPCPVSLRHWFQRLVQQTRAEVLLLSHAWFDGLVDHASCRGLVRVMDTHDLCTVNQQLWREVTRLLKEFKSGRRAPDLFDEELAWREVWKPEPAELAIYDRYHAVIAVSPREEQILRTHLERARVFWLPITVPGTVTANAYDGNALCTAGQNPFNLQGLVYFAHRVLPLVRQAAPDFTLDVTGEFGDQLMVNDRIQHLGFVPDLDPLYRRAAMFVCPVFTGTGQQVKIVEAMANGLPVVAFRTAAASSPLKHDENGLIATNAVEFAEHVARLWRDPGLRRRLGSAARETTRQWADQFDCARMLPQIFSVPSA